MSTSNARVNIDFVTQYVGRGNVQNANHDVSMLGASVKKLGTIFAAAFSGAELLNFSKQAVAAFAADDKSAKILSNTLSNLGLAFTDVPVENFISKLSELNGIAKTDLRSSFQSLVRQTLDSTKAQNLLNLSMDVSKGTGKDLATVSTAISKAYGGNYTALSKLGAGLTKADLASKDFNLIQTKLANTFKGSAATAADTFSGKIDRLKTSFEDFKITIGSGIVDAFSTATANGGSIDKFQTGMAAVALNIADTVRGVGVLLGYIDKAVAKLPTNKKDGGSAFSLSGLAEIIPGVTQLKILMNLGNKSRVDAAAAAKRSLGTANQQFDKVLKDFNTLKAAQDKLARDKAAQDKAALTAANAIKKAAADKLALERAALGLKLAGSTVDMQNIEIQAALQRGQTQQVNDVLLLQRAILNGNADQATYLAQKVLTANGLVMDVNGNISNLATAKDPFKDWPTASAAAVSQIKLIEDELAKLVNKTITVTVNTLYTSNGVPIAPTVSPGGNANTGNPLGGPTDYSNYVGSAMPTPSVTSLNPKNGADRNGVGGTPAVTVILNGAAVANAVQQTIVDNTASGTSSTYTRSLMGAW